MEQVPLDLQLVEKVRKDHHALGNHLTTILTTLELIEIYQSKGMEVDSEDFATLREAANGIFESLRAARQSFNALVGEPK